MEPKLQALFCFLITEMLTVFTMPLRINFFDTLHLDILLMKEDEM